MLHAKIVYVNPRPAAAAAAGLRLMAYYGILATGLPAACSTILLCFNHNIVI